MYTILRQGFTGQLNDDPLGQEQTFLEVEMARMTKAQKITKENEEQAIAFFEQMLKELPDPRRRQGLRYPLRTVVGRERLDGNGLWGR